MRLLLLAVLGLAASADAETLSNLITDTRVLALDAASTTRQRFSDSTITQWLNVGQRQAMAQTWCLQASYTMQLQQGVTYYALPSDYLAMRRLTIGAKMLQEMTPAALDGRSRGWEVSSGYPTYYFINFSSPTSLGFAPFPQTATDTDTVKVEYLQNAADLVSSSDVPFNGNAKLYEYHHSLAYFAAAMALSTYGALDRTSAYLAIYAASVTQMKDRCRGLPNYLPSATGTP